MVIEELTTRLGFQVDPNGLDKGKHALDGFKKWAAGIGVAAGAAFAYLAKTGVDAAMTMESITAQFRVMTGSAEKATSLISDIADFASKTPFTKLGLSEAGKTLMAFGLESEKVVPTLRMLGDVAGADQNRLNSLALVFGQIQSTGKLMGQDLLQLINQGFNPLTVMAKATGKSVADLKDLMAEGAISADDVTRAFQIATSEGGLFFGNLEAQSQTLAGKLSTLKDNVETALQNMAEAFFPLLKQLTDAAIAIDWTPIVNGAQNVANAVGNLSELVDTLVTWLKGLSPLFLLVFGPRLRMMMTSAIMQTRAYAAAQLFLQRAHLAAGAAANYQLTVMGLLKAGMFSVGQAAKGMGAGMKAAFSGVLGYLNIVLVGLTAIKELYDYFITDARNELKKEFDEMDKELFKQDIGGPEGQMELREKSFKKAKKEYTKLLNEPGATDAAIEKARKDYTDAKQLYEDGLGLYKAVRGIEWSTVKAKGTASQGVQQTLKESNHAINIDNKFDFEIASPSDKNTRTGLTAADVAQLANQAIDAAFNIRLKSLIVGAM